ncbi:zinc finger protein 100-like [Anopheles bellator]|uniref:zinc finger protein 100-like n=1 Tax=Anopheles bellator TaxID=139047 RepID=UPI0026499FAE|nr:zinc finger protein 100-like [Anopheles bellator]
MSNSNCICRLCMAEGVEPESDFELLNQNEDLQQIIRSFTTVEVILNTNCQYFICSDCHSALQGFQAFRDRCIINDEIFRHKYRSHSEQPSNTSYDSYELKAMSNSFDSDQLPHKVEEIIIEPAEDTYQEESEGGEYSPTVNRQQAPTKRSRNKAVPTVTKSNKLPCIQCGKMIARNNMKQHLLTHDPDRPKVVCSYCGKSFKDPARMQLHVNSNHTLEKKYPCEICGKTYLRPNSLRDHIKTKHTNDKQYECSECGILFNNWAKRWHHFKKEHTTAKPFACTYCDWAFKFKGDLTLHIRKHTGEKPFKCDICGKAFNKSYNVVIHKKSHRNVVRKDA